MPARLTTHRVTGQQHVQNFLNDATTDSPYQLHIIGPIGEGTFSTVYLAEMEHTDGDGNQPMTTSRASRLVAIKHVVPTSSPERTVSEIECLRLAEGRCNVIPLLFCHRVESHVFIGMPFIHSPTAAFTTFVINCNLDDVINYIGQLLTALRHIHSIGVIHRDVKPANFLYDPYSGKYALVDFGLSMRLLNEDMFLSSSNENSFDNEEHTVSCSTCGGPKDTSTGKSPTSGPREIGTKKAKVSSYAKLRRSPRKHLVPNYLSPKTDVQSIRTKSSPSPLSPNFTLDSASQRSPFQQAQTENHIYSGVLQQSHVGGNVTAMPSMDFAATTATSDRSSIFAGLPANPSLTSSASTASNAWYNHGGIDADGKLSQKDRRYSVESALQSAFPATPYNTNHRHQHCQCATMPQVCSACLHLPLQKAARAGTPGFRPPEVLLKVEIQSTGVDIWAVGVILLSLLSRTYPFFRAQDDSHALGELAAIFGTRRICQTAANYGKALMIFDGQWWSDNLIGIFPNLNADAALKATQGECSADGVVRQADGSVNWATFTSRLASRYCDIVHPTQDSSQPDRCKLTGPTSDARSEKLISLLSQMLALDANERISAADALLSPVFEGVIR